MHISVVTRCTHGKRQIGRLLSGILAQTWPDVEVLVVDSRLIGATINVETRLPVKREALVRANVRDIDEELDFVN